MNKEIYLKDINFFKFIYILLLNYKRVIIFLLIFTLIFLFIFPYQDLFSLIKLFAIILFFGLFLSYTIHEYAHIFIMKLLYDGHIQLEIKWYRISIIPKFDVQGYELILIALSGPLMCVLIAVVLFIIQYYLSNYLIFILSMVYATHVINILPVFGDGSMFIKGIIDLSKSKEVK